MPNGTYGGVRGRRLITASYSIALVEKIILFFPLFLMFLV